MLVSLAFGIFILCVVYVAYWSVKNDAAESIEEQVGFIRMRLPKSVRRTAPAERPADTSARDAAGSPNR